MIDYIKRDVVYPVGPGSKVICHCVNDIGVMGAGVALALLKKWPQVKSEYIKWYKNEIVQHISGKFALGEIQLVKVEKNIVVCNIVGQRDIRSINGVRPIRYESIEKGFSSLRRLLGGVNFSVHAPRLGSGLAGGEWDKIEHIIEEILCKNGVPVTVYDFP